MGAPMRFPADYRRVVLAGRGVSGLAPRRGRPSRPPAGRGVGAGGAGALDLVRVSEGEVPRRLDPAVGDHRVGQTLRVHLREGTPDDLEALAGVAARVRATDGYPGYLPHNDLARFLSRPEQVSAWVAEIACRVIGHVALTAMTSSSVMRLVRVYGIHGDVAFIARLLVDPSARRQGVGTRLLEHARREAIARGCIPLLDVLVTSRSAILLYRRRGRVRSARRCSRCPAVKSNSSCSS
jgi:ribosomal protein S18 acetylase RimI-like enzyme